MEILDGIATIAERYDGYVLDLWGVVHDGRKPYPGVPEALAELKARGKAVCFLTNAPRRAWEELARSQSFSPRASMGAQ